MSAPASPPVSSVHVGIDIEHGDHLPVVSDPWTDAFYVENFTPAEIAYCQRQPNPRESFAGAWCAKEAAIKCGREFGSLRPIDLEIQRDGQGRPTLAVAQNGKFQPRPDCEISISHSHGVAIAVCIAGLSAAPATASSDRPVSVGEQPAASSRVVPWLALGFSVLSLALWIWFAVKGGMK